MHANSHIAVLWTFKISKYLGISVLHQSKLSKIAGTVLQIFIAICTICWIFWSDSFSAISLQNKVTFGVLHVLTSYSASALTFHGWRKTHEIQGAVNALNDMESEVEKISTDVILQCITWAVFSLMIFLDVILANNRYIDHFENFVYYVPLLQILMVSNQFITLVKQAEMHLCVLMKKAGSSKTSNAELIKNYIKLYNVCKLIGDSYSFQNLVILIHHMFAATFGLSYFLQAALKMYPATLARKKLFLNSLSSGIFLYFIFLKFKFCQSIQLKAKEFKESLLDRLDKRSEDIWSSYLEFNHKDIKFSAFNVYNFDYETLNNIITILITYQVVLLQFALGRKQAHEDLKVNATSPAPK